MTKSVNEDLSKRKAEAFEDRVKLAFDGASLGEISEKTGVNYHTLRNYLKLQRDIPTDVLIRLSALSKCSIHWLLTGEGPKEISASRLPQDEPAVYFGDKEREIIEGLSSDEGRTFDDQVRELVLEALRARGLVTDKVGGVTLNFFGKFIPRLRPMRLWGMVEAGRPIEVFEDYETVMVPEEFFMPGRENFALRVRGDSMEDEGIYENDIIICYESPVAENGDTVVALIDGRETTVKKFYREGKRVRLQPKSARHEPIILSPDRVKIQGVVTGIFRKT